jgi:hypothetical protein
MSWYIRNDEKAAIRVDENVIEVLNKGYRVNKHNNPGSQTRMIRKKLSEEDTFDINNLSSNPKFHLATDAEIAELLLLLDYYK